MAKILMLCHDSKAQASNLGFPIQSRQFSGHNLLSFGLPIARVGAFSALADVIGCNGYDGNVMIYADYAYLLSRTSKRDWPLKRLMTWFLVKASSIFGYELSLQAGYQQESAI